MTCPSMTQKNMKCCLFWVAKAPSPDAQHVVVATARWTEAAGVTHGRIEEEEGLIHGGGLTETWPVWKLEKVEELGGKFGRGLWSHDPTICPHCKDTIGTQYKHLGKHFSGVVSHQLWPIWYRAANSRLKSRRKTSQYIIPVKPSTTMNTVLWTNYCQPQV